MPAFIKNFKDINEAKEFKEFNEIKDLKKNLTLLFY